MEAEARCPVVARIKKIATGEVRTHNTDLYQDEDGPSTFTWEDGNNSCDCNRYLFFQRAGGDEEIEEDDVCGDKERYLANIYTEDGECIYREFDESPLTISSERSTVAPEAAKGEVGGGAVCRRPDGRGGR